MRQKEWGRDWPDHSGHHHGRIQRRLPMAGGKFVIGVPKEIKADEYRVAMIPVGVEELTKAGHKVLIQAGAGQGSGISDEQYAQHGAEIVTEAADIWKRAELIVKVKEPLP